jgi:hypothetical protein
MAGYRIAQHEMSDSVTLSGDRIRLRPWRDEDREAFAARAAHNEPGIEHER